MNDKAPQTNSSTRGYLIIGIGLIILATGSWYAFSPASNKTADASTPTLNSESPDLAESKPTKQLSEKTAEKSQDELYQDKLIGTWVQKKGDTRTLELKQDGTGTLTIESTSLQAMLLGELLVLKIEWKVEDGSARFVSLSGKPESGFNTIKQIYGTTLERIIQSLEDDKLVLLDSKDQSESVWQRNSM